MPSLLTWLSITTATAPVDEQIRAAGRRGLHGEVRRLPNGRRRGQRGVASGGVTATGGGGMGEMLATVWLHGW